MFLKISNVDSTTGGRRHRSQSEQRGPGSPQGNADPPPATATTWFICRWSGSRAPRPLSLLVNTYDDESTRPASRFRVGSLDDANPASVWTASLSAGWVAVHVQLLA